MAEFTLAYTYQLTFARVMQVEFTFLWCDACQEWHLNEGSYQWGSVNVRRWFRPRNLGVMQDFPQQ